MKTLLIVDASPNSATSNTRKLTAAYADAWLASNPGSRVIRRDVSGDAVAQLSQDTIGAFYTPEDQRSEAQQQAVAQSDELVDELFAADEVVLGSPMHNFSVTVGMKSWVDQICRVGRTFNYTEQGPKGELAGRKAVIVASSGGNYADGTPMAHLNHNDTYLKTVLGFVGITDVSLVSAGGVAMDAAVVDQAQEQLLALV
ncbi:MULTISPECIES: FMN-dependent NADH-azoreductase [Ferrimonas]|uniref:FMN-dependent NADH-azoreductase n=1 Tax=Ferrimonas TaxID=44011 RepID=UPI0004011ED6|nr:MULTISPECIES: NAD(P)H-dependent oxidoreductase [Ferrimonas]USD35805.1 NAD(P)H-dependent oxidoreductase [Ferrimonas sp. SCSIO 43195]